MIEDTISKSLGLQEQPERVILGIQKELTYIMANGDSNVSGEKNPFYGKTHDDETKKIISQKQIGNKKRLGKTHTKEAKQKISEASIERFKNQEERDKISKSLKGNKLSDETKLKMSKSKRGLKKSEAHIMKIKISNMNAKQIECMHCGKSMTRGLHNRWHGKNCRYMNV